jgi:hypothetical protein
MAKIVSTRQKLRPSSRTKLRQPEKKAKPFYLSPEWRGLMAQIIKVRGRRCEDPRHDPSRPRTGIRVFGDHIVELADGGSPLNPANVMLRCGSCHTRKTAVARAARMQGGGGGPISEAPGSPNRVGVMRAKFFCSAEGLNSVSDINGNQT